MKKVFLLVCVSAMLYSFMAPAKPITTLTKDTKNTTPESLLTEDSIYWTTSTFSSLKYASVTEAPDPESLKDAGMVAKFKFKKDDRFELLMYVQSDGYGSSTETWTMIEGDVEFVQDARGQNVFITHADKGNHRVVKNGRTTSRKIQQGELENEYSNTYLWERINFPGDKNRTWLLTVNLDEHPAACVKVQGSIDRSWVTKFYIPIVK